MIRTFLVVLFVATVAVAQTPDESKATLTYLLSLQDKGGGFRPDAESKEPTLRGTLASIRAIRYFGGTLPNPKGCRAFVASCRHESGSFANVPGGKNSLLLTAVGLMARVDLGMREPHSQTQADSLDYLTRHAKEFEEVRLAAAALESTAASSPMKKAWSEKLLAKCNKDGTWGRGKAQARDTGGHAAAVLRLGGKGNAAAVVEAMDEGQRTDGGFGTADKDGSDLETTYRVMRAYRMLRKKPAKADSVSGFLARCRNKDGGYGIRPGVPSSTGGTYFAGIVLHWLGEK